jgi:hypothetical protein
MFMFKPLMYVVMIVGLIILISEFFEMLNKKSNRIEIEDDTVAKNKTRKMDKFGVYGK